MIMSDYSKHPYSELVEHIEKVSQQYSPEHNFALDILDMENAETIKALIKTFNNVFVLLVFDFWKRNTNIPMNFYMVETWGRSNNQYVYMMYQCLNENILGWLKRQVNPTYEQCTSAILNLRYCENRFPIESEILKLSKIYYQKNLSYLIKERDYFRNLRLEINKGNNYLLSKYKEVALILDKKGYVFDYIEDSFAKKHNFDYLKLRNQYNEKVKNAEIAKERMMILQKKNEKKEKIKSIITCVFVLFALFVFLYLFQEIGPILVFPILFYMIGLALLAL